jgi:hypothetical protein
MARIEFADAIYPELQLAVMREEIRREQRQQEERDAVRRRRRARWARLSRWLKSLVE